MAQDTAKPLVARIMTGTAIACVCLQIDAAPTAVCIAYCSRAKRGTRTVHAGKTHRTHVSAATAVV